MCRTAATGVYYWFRSDRDVGLLSRPLTNCVAFPKAYLRPSQYKEPSVCFNESGTGALLAPCQVNESDPSTLFTRPNY